MSVNNAETSGCVQIGSTTYDSLTAAVAAASAGDTLWLCDDDVTVQQVTIGKSLTIELQGHELSSTALKITGSSTSVTINDRVGTGSINKNHAAGFSTDHNRCTATIVVADCATLTINGVTGTNADTGTVVYDSATADLVKALFVQGASTLVINGGTFVAQQGAGRDALFVYDGTVTINDGYFLMNLSYLTAPTDAKPLTIKKCEIYNPSDSGAIWIQNSGTINGVSFNSGYQSLDNIRKLFLSTDAGNYLLSDSTKNHVKIGCGIYASSEISSTTLPDGTTYAVGSTNEDSPEQINPTTGSKITLAPQIAGGDGATITYTWEKDGSTLAGATDATYTIGSYSNSDDGSYKVTATEGGKSVSLYYQIGTDVHTHCVCGGSITTGDHAKHTSATWTAWDGTSDIEYTNGVASVYLSDSAERSSVLTVKDGNTLNLCLNGNTLSRSYTVIAVKDNATLNICDCKGGGEIVSPSGCAVSVTTQNNSNAHTTLNLYGGKVSSKSYSMLDPGAINLYNNDANNAQTVAVFNMYGGEVCHEDVGESAIYASYANVGTGYYQINMYGGNITCEQGNGFDFNNNKNVAMQVAGGTITAGWYGIWLSSQNTLTLSGNPRFVDKAYFNNSAGIYIPAEVALTVAEDFAPAEGTTISVDKTISSVADDAVIARSATSGSSLADKAQYFVSSEEGYFVECNTSGNLQLTACTITDQPTVDNSYTVTANGGSTNKVAYQWYKATSGKVAVTNKNATTAEKFSYSSYSDEWFPNYNPMSADQVTLEAFTLHMAKDDVLTVKYQDSDYDEDNSQGRFDNFTLIGADDEVVGTAGTESRYKTYAFTAPADGDYTLKATATPGTYEDSYGDSARYNLFCNFSATVTEDVAGDALSGQTAAALNTAELENDKYICGVTWEGKTTLYSNAVEFSAPVHTHCVCGKTDCSGDEHDVTTKWTKWESDNSLPADAGNYYLDSSVTLSDTWNISSGVSINLCLNGNTICGASGKDVIKVNSGASLAITDCTTESTNVGKITHTDGSGRGINNKGTLTLWNGTITGNTTYSDGGGVYNSSNCTFTMYGGSITDNNASGYSEGGGVYNYGIFNIYGGSITKNKTNGRAGGVWNWRTVNLSGNVTISGNTDEDQVSNLYMYDTEAVSHINVEGSLAGTASVGITIENKGRTTDVGGTTSNTGLFCDDENYEFIPNGSGGLKLTAVHKHCICGKATAEGDTHTHDTTTKWTPWTNTDSLPTQAGNYYLMQNVNLEGTWTVSDTVNLCLNGKTITGKSDYHEVIHVGGSLVITDCQGGGKITHDTSVTKAQGIRNYGTLTLWNGSITGNTSTDNGGGVWNTGAFNMYGGSITGNSAKRGGGVYNDISAAFTMTGGEISGNTASDYSGGGVHNEDQFNMTGGTISGNTAKGGGGVYTGNTVGTSVFTMSDTAIITGNSAEQGGGVLIVDGKFNMTGGSITKNWTTAGSYNYGGGVRIEENGKFNMTGGSITENTTNSSLGGGVYNDGTFNMSGNPQIAGNVMGGTIEDGALKTGTGTTNNVCLTNNEKIITVDTAGMDNTAKVGINVQDPEILPTVVTGSTNTNVFSSDSADYKLVDNKEGGLKLANQEVTISGVTLLNEAEGAAMADSKKVYDGKAVAYDGGTYEPSVTGSLTYTWQVKEEGSETYTNITDNIAPKDAGSYRLLVEFKRGDTVLGSANYDFTISKAELTIENLAVAGKDYDGNNTAAISSEPTLSGLVGDETVTLINGTPTFSSVSAGNGIDISFTDFSIEGDAAKNYTLTQPTGIKANITAAPLTITGATVTSKKYDGNNNATVSDVIFDGLKNGETLTINTDYTISNAKYDGVNATGEGAATKVDFDVALSDTTLANNYKLKTEKGTQDSQTIKKADTANKTSSTSGIRGQENTFDMPDGFMVEGANIASITITQDANSIIARTPAYEDNTLTYELNSTAENGQTATTQLKITSQNYNDYYIDITVGVDEKQEIAITIDDATLTYNATPQAPTGITVENSVVPTSELVITYIGTDSTVYQESSTAPTDAGTYSMSVSVPDTNNKYKGTATKAFTIAPKEISATLKAENKTYDGSTSAQASATLTGVLASDADKVTATVTNPAFENKTAAENKKVTANISLKGDAAGNYTVNTTAETTANITAKPLTINPLVIAEKYYDGTNKADFIATPKLVGVESDDEVTLVNGVPTFSTVAVGRDIPINFTDFTLDGDDKDNYTLTQPTGITGDISAYIPFGLEYTPTTTDWTNQDFVVTAKSGWLVSETNTAEGTWSESLTRSAETGSDGDSLTFYVKNTNYGYISIAITKTYKIDKTVPVISGAEDNKTYCAAVTLTITDDNLESVSINGKAATPTESGTLTLEPAAGAQNVVATDKAGNSATLTVTVNDGHTWGAWTSNGNNTHSRTCALDATHTETASCHGGKATCTDKAVCDDCKLVYGELDPNNHADLKHVEAKAATTTTEGNIEYWYCTGCDKYFASESGQDEITEPDTVIKKLPVITKGDNAKVAQGTSEPLSFTSDADFADFLRVEVDGTILDSKHYAVASGSTVVTLNANYVATLAAGEHVLGIVSQNGTATASFTVDKKAEEITPTPDKPTTNTSATTSPQTGDSAALFVWLTLLFVSGSAATITALAGRKRKNN